MYVNNSQLGNLGFDFQITPAMQEQINKAMAAARKTSVAPVPATVKHSRPAEVAPPKLVSTSPAPIVTQPKKLVSVMANETPEQYARRVYGVVPISEQPRATVPVATQVVQNPTTGLSQKVSPEAVQIANAVGKSKRGGFSPLYAEKLAYLSPADQLWAKAQIRAMQQETAAARPIYDPFTMRGPMYVGQAPKAPPLPVDSSAAELRMKAAREKQLRDAKFNASVSFYDASRKFKPTALQEQEMAERRGESSATMTTGPDTPSVGAGSRGTGIPGATGAPGATAPANKALLPIIAAAAAYFFLA